MLGVGAAWSDQLSAVLALGARVLSLAMRPGLLQARRRPALLAGPEANSARRDDVPETDARSLAILRDSLAEAQTTVRAYDTKAQIVGVG